jgi:hypothetical protein
MNLQSYYRSMFFFGALWNWGAGMLFFFAYKPIFAWLGMKELNYPVLMYAFLILVFVFGIGYYWVSRDINKNHDIVKMGFMGKTLLFFLYTYYYLMGEVHLLIEMCLFVDLVFAILFMEFLLRARKLKHF